MTDNNDNVTQRRSYDYDKHGNVTKQAAETDGSSTSFTYNKANKLKSAGSRNFVRRPRQLQAQVPLPPPLNSARPRSLAA